MSNSAVVVGNVHVMMAYAFRNPGAIPGATAKTERFEHVHDLYAHIIAEETSRQVKRGIHHDYYEQVEELPTLRGRVDINRTLAARSTTRGRLICRFDEFLPDTPHNRAIKATGLMLARHKDVAPQRKAALERLAPFFTGVTLVPLRAIRWKDLAIHRHNSSYRMLLAACELAASGLLPSDAAGMDASRWATDQAMSALFERFVLAYFRFHHPQLDPRALNVKWDLAEQPSTGIAQLPTMRTDVTLTSETGTLIIDTKYYGTSMQASQYGKQTIHSGNLYQLQSYVRNLASQQTHPVSGLLLYARTDGPTQPELDVLVGGHRMGATTLDLAVPWPHLRMQLEHLLTRF